MGLDEVKPVSCCYPYSTCDNISWAQRDEIYYVATKLHRGSLISDYRPHICRRCQIRLGLD